MDNVVLIIPSLEPKREFIDLLLNAQKKIKNIIVVNDGSSSNYDTIFKRIEKANIIVLKHHVNLGKGQALKTAFHYVLKKFPRCEVVVTADSDGQHAIKDILKCAKGALEDNNSLVLGVRNFNEKQVPIRNRFGNKLSNVILKSFYDIKITDSQTGLRACSLAVLKKIIDVKGSRFEYETNVLIAAKRKNIPFKEIDIETIYLADSNHNSHFNSFTDSYKIYRLFANQIIFSLLSYILNITTFSIIYLYDHSLLILALICSKIISISSYILLNRDRRYQKNYFLGELGCLFISSLIIIILSFYTKELIILKIITDLLLILLMTMVRFKYN